MLVGKIKRTLMLVVFICTAELTFGGEVYVAPPIIFVHGLNSNEDTWNDTKSQLEKYFIDKDTDELKYDYVANPIKSYTYFPYCDYEPIMNTRDIPTIARGVLKRAIYNGLESIPAGCTEKKVNVVAHSMGGLVTRSFLKQRPDLQSSINKVVFVGTPHTGSPYASSLWLLDKVHKDVLPWKIRENTYYAATAFAKKDFTPNDRKAYDALLRSLQARYNNIGKLLWFTKEKIGIDSESPAIEQLRLNQDVSYYDVIFGQAWDKLKTAEVAASYSGSETFLAEGNNNLSDPRDYESIVGINMSSNLIWELPKLIRLGDAIDFPEGESLDDVKMYDGDGVVSLNSQSALGSVTFIVSNHLEEPKQWEAILDALDDSPVIEDMYVAKWPATPAYVVVKVKDYLLADIEIVSMTVDGDPADLSEFNDGEGHYKPYAKFGKQFLRERQDTNVLDEYGNPLTLSPGEFYIELSLDEENSHTVDIQIKNPSTNPPAQKSLIIASLRLVGSWGVDIETGDWAGFSSEDPEVATTLNCVIRYDDNIHWVGCPLPWNYYYTDARGGVPWYPPSGEEAAYLYKIELPSSICNIDYIDVTLRRKKHPVSENESMVRKYIRYWEGYPPPEPIGPNYYPLNVSAEVKIDYSFNSPVGNLSPIGNYNLLYEEIGGTLRQTSGSPAFTYKKTKTWLSSDTLFVTIPVDAAVEIIWISIYPVNIQSMVTQLELHARNALNPLEPPEPWRGGWNISISADYSVEDIYFHFEE